MSLFEEYPCVGVCDDDPDSGYCLGCGRPPAQADELPGNTIPPASLVVELTERVTVTEASGSG